MMMTVNKEASILYCKPGVHKFFNNLRATSKF